MVFGSAAEAGACCWMSEPVLLEEVLVVDHMNVGWQRHMLRLPAAVGRRRAAAVAKRARSIMEELSDENRALHRFLVTELPVVGAPLTTEWIGGERGVPASNVAEQLDELGERKALIARNRDGDVTWAYPVAVEPTAHHLSFRSGERLYAA